MKRGTAPPSSSSRSTSRRAFSDTAKHRRVEDSVPSDESTPRRGKRKAPSTHSASLYDASLALKGRSPFDMLPLDLVRLIMEYLPWRARLRVVSLVSSRFSIACRQSITHLNYPPLEDANIIDPLRVLPNVRSLDLVWLMETARPPFECLSQLSSLHSLHSASMRVGLNIQFASWALEHLPASLTSLSIVSRDSTHLQVIQSKFTALQHLHVEVWNNDIPLQLYRITELTFVMPPIDDSYAFPQLPYLRQLRIPCHPTELQPYMHLMPALESISLRVLSTACLSALEGHFNHLTLEVSLQPSIEQPWLTDGLKMELTRLRRLSRLVSLEVMDFSIDVGPLSTLTKLIFSFACPWPIFSSPLPRMRTLRLPYMSSKNAPILALVLPNCPRLTVLRIDIYDKPGVAALRKGIALAAKHRSLEALLIDISRSEHPVQCDNLHNYAFKFPWLFVHFTARCSCSLCKSTEEH